MNLYQRVANLDLQVDGYELQGLELQTAEGWTRKTTVVRLFGKGKEGQVEEGLGEDVTYQPQDQERLQALGKNLPLQGQCSLDEFSQKLDHLDLFFGQAPVDPAARLLRRWGFESAALDLALRQNKLSLSQVLDRPLRPLSFVASLGLAENGDLAPIRQRLAKIPEMGFKLDFAGDWTAATVDALVDIPGILTIDLKGQYRGDFQGPPAIPELYARIAEKLPQVWIEDPDWSPESAKALLPYQDRVTWDAVLHSLADIEQRPNPQRAINIKPSRFGCLSELMRVYAYCENRGLQMYSGGQFELGPGRDQIQYLAAMFHTDSPNDAAPTMQPLASTTRALCRRACQRARWKFDQPAPAFVSSSATPYSDSDSGSNSTNISPLVTAAP